MKHHLLRLVAAAAVAWSAVMPFVSLSATFTIWSPARNPAAAAGESGTVPEMTLSLQLTPPKACGTPSAPTRATVPAVPPKP